MTATEHKSAICLALSNQNVNQLINELATKCEEIDGLKAQVDTLKGQLSPKPVVAED